MPVANEDVPFVNIVVFGDVPISIDGLLDAAIANTSLVEEPITKYGFVPPGALRDSNPYGDVVAIPTLPP